MFTSDSGGGGKTRSVSAAGPAGDLDRYDRILTEVRKDVEHDYNRRHAMMATVRRHRADW